VKFFNLCGMLAGALVASGAAAQESTAVKELIPTGKLRVGVVFAPAPSAFFVVKEANGEPRGVTVDLAVELGRKLGVPVEFMVAPNSGLVTDATESGAIDVAFMPVDEERKKRVDFGPAYLTGASGIKTVAEVDRPDVRVVGIANTTTIRRRTFAEKHLDFGRDLGRRRNGYAALWQGRCLRTLARFTAAVCGPTARFANR
jgi:polar amino acid transport system substrate-binding protein